MQYTVTINDHDLQILSAALVELPFKTVAPLVDKLNRQIAEQAGNTDAVKAKEEKNG